MRYALQIGVSLHPEERCVGEEAWCTKIEKRFRDQGVRTKRCDTDGNIVNGVWRFEGLLADPDYIPSRVAMLLGLAGNPNMLAYFSLEADHNIEGLVDRGYSYRIGPEEATLMSVRGDYALLFLLCKRCKPFPPEKLAAGFQRLAEWFTLQTSMNKAIQQGQTALAKHHRFADARSKLEELEGYSLLNFSFPPLLPP